MKLSSIVAVISAFAVVIFTNHTEGDPAAALFNVEAAVIVLLGSAVAALGQFHLDGLLRGIRGLKWLVRPPLFDGEAFIEQISDWARKARREGLLSLEPMLDELEDRFLREGMQMVIDGIEVKTLRSVLQTKMQTEEAEDEKPAALWESIGGYAPTLGVLGAVMGLIHVMLHLSGNGSGIGVGIAAAFVATLYGVGAANLLFLPIGKRLGQVVEQIKRQREMTMEGVIAIAEGANPQTVKTHLAGFVRRKPQTLAEQEEKIEPRVEPADVKT